MLVLGPNPVRAHPDWALTRTITDLDGRQCSSAWRARMEFELEWHEERKGRDPSCIGVTGADRGCEGPHDGPPEDRIYGGQDQVLFRDSLKR